ncbi:unnamed protein product [Leuciscus chuanchicus]
MNLHADRSLSSPAAREHVLLILFYLYPSPPHSLSMWSVSPHPSASFQGHLTQSRGLPRVGVSSRACRAIYGLSGAGETYLLVGMFACLRSGRAGAEACEECRRGREKLFNRSETSKHVERLVGEGCCLSSPPGG